MPTDTLEHVAAAILLVSGSYLCWRLALLCLRVRWARRAYPPAQPSEASTDEEEDRCRAVLLGLAVGDALGLPAEQLPRWLVQLRYPAGPAMRRGWLRFMRRAGDISDDTQLSIAVARSIGPDGQYMPERFLDELRLWATYRAAAGRATTLAANRLARRLDDIVPTARPSDGNGAAIRVAPLAVARRHDKGPGALLDDVAANCRTTHGGQLAHAGAALVALLVWEALRSPKGTWADPTVVLSEVRRLAEIAGFPLDRFEQARAGDPLPTRQLERVGTSAYALHSVSAVLVLLTTCGGDFRCAMNAIFRAGGDTDSIGAMVGAILGAAFGTTVIPAEWLGRVCHHAYLSYLGSELWRRARAEPPNHRGELVEVRGDVASREVDAVVNAWNRNVIPPWLLLPQGVSKAIRHAGGKKAIKAVGKRAPMPLGSATETGAGRLGCGWVIHVAGISLAWRASADSTRASARRANRAGVAVKPGRTVSSRDGKPSTALATARPALAAERPPP